MKRSSSAGKGSPGKKSVNAILFVLLAVAAAAFCFSGYKLITIWLRYHEASVSYDSVHKAVQSETGDNSYIEPDSDLPDIEDYYTGTSIEGSRPDLRFEYEDEYDEGMVYNYQALLEINPDTIGYIKARGGGKIVDYPIVQGSDNEFYTDHMFDGTYNKAGSIFMDCNAYGRFSMPYSILYGHNMASGSRMFGWLKQYENEEYYKAHTEYDIFTPYSHYVYKVFAVIKTTYDGYLYQAPLLGGFTGVTDDEQASEIREFGEYALSQSEYDTGYKSEDLNEKTRFIALSTCYNDNSDPARYIILLIRDRIVIKRPVEEDH